MSHEHSWCNIYIYNHIYIYIYILLIYLSERWWLPDLCVPESIVCSSSSTSFLKRAKEILKRQREDIDQHHQRIWCNMMQPWLTTTTMDKLSRCRKQTRIDSTQLDVATSKYEIVRIFRGRQWARAILHSEILVQLGLSQLHEGGITSTWWHHMASITPKNTKH